MLGRLRKSYAVPTTRERLFDMLAESGVFLQNPPIGAQGYYRISAKYDDTTVCWEGYAKVNGTFVHVVSYDTMTACVRRGFTASDDSGLLWVYAKPKESRDTRAIRMLDRQVDRLLANKPHSTARARRLCQIEERRTELADSIGAC